MADDGFFAKQPSICNASALDRCPANYAPAEAMVKMFRPDSDRLRCLGFDSVAEVPVLFDNAGRYCRAHNRYLRERALGEAGLGSHGDFDEPIIPLPKTIENVTRYLGVFIDWCDFRKVDWRTLGYRSGVLRFQNDMAFGRWSPSGRKLAAGTANQRADAITSFLTWAADRGLRPAFKVAYKIMTRQSAGQGTVSVRLRPGRLKQSNSDEVEKVTFLPRPEEVPKWLQAVREKRGYSKYLASRFVVETGVRLFETVAVTVDQIPSKEMLEQLANAGQTTAPITLVVTKGSRPRTISVAIAFVMEIRLWIEGKRLRLLYLWDKREHSAPSSRLFLSDARDHEGTPISEARLYDCFHNVKPRPVKWNPHFGRHTYACFYVLYAIEYEAKSAGRALSKMGADWIVARGGWYFKTLRKQLGHLSEETTDLYLRWLVTASGLAEAAVGWHNFLAGGLDGAVTP